MASHNTDDMQKNDNISHHVTPWSMILTGSAVFTGAAALVGTAHYHGTAKKLKEEGIPISARQRALPLAIKALASSTLGCLILGGMAVVSFSALGGEYKRSAGVGSWSSAMVIVQRQRDLVRQQFQQILSGNVDASVNTKDSNNS